MNYEVTNPITGFSVGNKSGALSLSLRSQGVFGYVSQEGSGQVFHVADVFRCLQHDFAATHAHLNSLAPEFRSKGWFIAVKSTGKSYWPNEGRGKDQSKTRRLKDTFITAWNNPDYQCQHPEKIFEHLWTEYQSHKHYFPLYDELFNKTTAEPAQVHAPATAHTHDDGTLCLTVAQYEAAKSTGLLEIINQPLKVAVQNRRI